MNAEEENDDPAMTDRDTENEIKIQKDKLIDRQRENDMQADRYVYREITNEKQKRQ